MKITVFVLLLSAHCGLIIALYRQHYFINEAKKWSEAQKYCRDKYEDLSSVDGKKDVLNLRYAINTGTTNIASSSRSFDNPYHDTAAWTGLYMISSVGWRWSDGSSVNHDDLRFYYNDNVKGCISFYSGWLHDFSCSNQLPFFCYKWEPELILVRENKSWEDALEHCRTHHTDLASLPSYLHLIQAKQITAMSETPRVWTGLRFLSGSWFWMSGEDLGYQLQLPACPADHSYCGSRNLNTQTWENRDCMEELYFLCY